MSSSLKASSLADLSESSAVIHVGDVRKVIHKIPDNSVHLIVTSPPYGGIKSYSDREGEIGKEGDVLKFHTALNSVWKECIRVLHPGCKLIINIGDEFLRTTKKRVYQIISHHAYIINNIMSKHSDNIVHQGTIFWSKVTTSKTNGGGKVMGSVYTPRDGHFFMNREYIMIFKKTGKAPKVKAWQKEEARFTLEERRVWFRDTWEIPGIRQDSHIAMFPDEIPQRLIRMYSFPGETVLDPFCGSGTTLAMAAKWNRDSIGIELGYGDNWKDVTQAKIKRYTKNLRFI